MATYCTVADLNRLMSAQAAVDFADHDGDNIADTGVHDDCIDEASQELELYLFEQYNPTDLTGSKIVERWCTLRAAILLCERRGNVVPEVWLNRWEEIELKLEKLRKDQLSLPGIKRRDRQVPGYSNVMVDRRYAWDRIRVTPNSSRRVENDPGKGVGSMGIGSTFIVR